MSTTGEGSLGQFGGTGWGKPPTIPPPPAVVTGTGAGESGFQGGNGYKGSPGGNLPISQLPSYIGGPPVIPGSTGQGTGDPGTTSQYDQSAYAFLDSTLKQYGLTSLEAWIKTQLINGTPQEQVALDIYQTPEFQARFPAIFSRQKAGLPPLSPTDYINLEDSYTQILSDAGMPAGFYDSKADFTNFIGNDVSPTEFKNRIDGAYETVSQAPQDVRNAFAQFYGPSGDAALAAYVLDSKTATPILLKHAQAAEIAGTGMRYGFMTNQGIDEGLAAQDITQQQADAGFAKGAMLQPLMHGTISDTDSSTLGEGGVTAGLFGSTPGASLALAQAEKAKQADFSGAGQAASSSTGIIGLGKSSSI